MTNKKLFLIVTSCLLLVQSLSISAAQSEENAVPQFDRTKLDCALQTYRTMESEKRWITNDHRIKTMNIVLDQVQYACLNKIPLDGIDFQGAHLG